MVYPIKQAIGNAGSITIPTAMFADAVSPSAQVTVVDITPVGGDAHGFQWSLPSPLSATTITAPAVTGTVGEAAFTVTAIDQAGNYASAVLTINLVRAPTVVLTAADARQVYTAGPLVSGGAASLTASKLVVTVLATFTDAMTGLTAGDLVVSGIATDQITMASTSSAYVYSFTVRYHSVVPDTSSTISLAAGVATRTTDGVINTASNVVTVLVDTASPLLNTTTLETASQTVPYFAYVPLSMFNFDSSGANNTNGAASSDASITVVSATISPAIGLVLTAGGLGRAYISGTASSIPASRNLTACGGYAPWVTFTLTVRDAAGNAATPMVCVKVATATVASLSIASSTVQAVEGAAAPALDGLAAFTSAASVYGVHVYLESPDRLSATERFTGTNPDPGLYTLVPYSQNPARVGVLSLVSTTDAVLTAANLQAFLRSVAYSNTGGTAHPGYRTARVVATYANGSEVETVVGYATRPIYFSITNSVPSVTGSLNVTFLEGNTDGMLIASNLVITDEDDTTMTQAAVSLKKANVMSAGEAALYGGCDPTRDVLGLPSTYTIGPAVVGSWSTITCTLTLTPIVGSTFTVGQLQLALDSVRYYNLDRYNPSNYSTSGPALARLIQLTVTDAGSGGLVSTTATSAPLGGAVRMTLVDDPPYFVPRVLYTPGGMGSSTNTTANIFKYKAEDGVYYNVRKTALAFSAEGTAVVQYTFDLDFLPVAGQLGVFAGGALVDYDTLTPMPATEPLGLSFVDTDGNPASPVGITAVAVYSNITTSQLTINVTEPIPSTGVLGVRLVYGTHGPNTTLWFDVRERKCIATPGFSTLVDISDADMCASLNATKVNATGATLLLGDYASAAAYLSDKMTTLVAAGMPLEDIVTAMAVDRSAKAGIVNVVVPVNAFSAPGGSLDIGLRPASTATLALLQAPPNGGVLDAINSVSLTPDCAAFSPALSFCQFAGDTPANFKRSLMIASLVDCRDPSKGFGAWQPVEGASFNPVTGEVCGKISHFSVVSPIMVPVPVSPTVSKTILMGGSCPNDCSGAGYCRTSGKCACFAGFSGYDCSQRACPAAGSWDRADGVVHKPTECSNRGVCDAKVGACKCFDGFEGAACQRTTCPNDCSGNGRCRFLKDLPAVVASGYKSWETERLQACVCDGGYTGPDCSQRVCPFGDDPETSCSEGARQVQTVTVDFGSLPAGVSNPAAFGLADTDDIALSFTAVDGSTYVTPAIHGMFDATNGADNVAKALKSLPSFAVSDVTVTQALEADKHAVSYAITFDGTSLGFALTALANARLTSAGNTVSGNQQLLQCVVGNYNTMGCQAAGCRPLFKQMRLLSAPSSGVTITPTAILRQPAPLSPGDSTVAVWGVSVVVTVAMRPETGTKTYSAVSQVYGYATGSSADAETVDETPIPPDALANNVPLVYGLAVSFDATVAVGSYEFKWRLPSCSVVETQAAGDSFEALECSRRGLCDRKLGQCKCFSGYAGANCGTQTVIV